MTTAFHHQRTEAFKSFLDREHFRFQRRPDAIAGAGEITLTCDWNTQLSAPCTPLTARMVEDFRRFCQECMEIELSGSGPKIVWRLTEPQSAEEFDRQDPKIEAFDLTVSDGEIEIRAAHERGLLHGTHYLEWLMADRGGPFLKAETIQRQPALMPRLSNGVFIHGHQTPEEPGAFSDDYLALMSHYGANGIHINVSIIDLFQSPSFPAFNAPGAKAKIAALRAFAQRTQRFGIDLYIQLMSTMLMEDHPLFQAHPEARGSLIEIFFEEVSGKPWHNLCSGSETVHRVYAETVETLFTEAPELAGGIIIIGGESFYHCFTRPANASNGDTNCPCCSGKSPSGEVAKLTNLIAAAVKKASVAKALYAWPYSAFIWASKDYAQIDWISQLDPSVSVLSNFDCGDADAATGSGACFFDYNIKCVGPSDVFAKQAASLHAEGRPIFAKVETNTTPDAFYLPYLPLHLRWQARLEAMKATGVAGYVGQWRFFGMNATPPEEWQYKATWRNERGEATLANYCQRDFGLSADRASLVLEGWRHLSESWESFPYSAMTSGERIAYMRGPWYLGPSHPLIFDVQDQYDLPDEFRLIRGDAAEMVEPEEFEELKRRAKPRYVSDLLLTLPFGVERFLELIGKCRAKWEQGMMILRAQLSGGTDRARKELDICEALGSHLTSVENVVRFYQARDRLHTAPCSASEFKVRLATIQQIIRDEIANAEFMLPILERELRIGYGHCYGPVYDAEMVRAKIVQCRRVAEVELPRFSQSIRFHVWLDSP